MPVAYRVDVMRRNIASQFLRGGQGYRWLDRVRLNMHRACVNGAPHRTYELARSHRSNIRGLNQYRAVAEVSNVARHAAWVHDGTSTIAAEGMSVPIYPFPAPQSRRRRRDVVSGQAANPWLDRACARVAMGEGAVRVS